MSSPEMVRRHRWVDADHDLALTIAVITGSTSSEVVRAYGGNFDDVHHIGSFADAWMPDYEPLGAVSYVQVRQQGRHVVTIENNGWLASDEDLAKRVSAPGRHFVSVYWNANGLYRLIEAQDARLIASFDPLFAVEPEDRDIDRGDILPPWLPDVRLELGALGSTMLAIVEKQTGLAFDRAWMDEPTPTYRISYPGSEEATTPKPVPVA